MIQALATFVVLLSDPTHGYLVAPRPVAALDAAAAGAQDTADAKQPKQKEPKQKKAKKKKSDAIAPDEELDPDQAVAVGAGGGHFSWKQHPSIRFGDVFRLNFQAKFQEDWRSTYDGAKGLFCANSALPKTCDWELHRSRIGIDGYFFKHIEYEVERELKEQELTDKEILQGYTPKSAWKDVDVNISFIKTFEVQAGRFKIPFGLDALTGDTHNDYAYRSLGANALAPSRDTGVMVHGRFFKRGLNYWVGGFQHDGENARSKKIQGGNDTFAARVTALPLRKMNPKVFGAFEVGTAVAITKVSDDPSLPNGIRGRTVLSQDTFYEAVYVNGQRHRWEADLDWTVGPASLRSEYTWLTDDRLKQGLGDQDLSDARARSWYVSGTWILTGEPKTRPVKAANEFLRGGFGAIEVAARYERLWFDSVGADAASAARNPRATGIFTSGDKALTLGVNWTINRWGKIQLNGIREQVSDPKTNPIASGGSFWSKVIRFQVVL